MAVLAETFLVLGICCAILSGIIAYRMRTQVNERVTRSQQTPLLIRGEAFWEMARLHKRFYSTSRLRIAWWLCLIGFIVSMIAGVAFQRPLSI